MYISVTPGEVEWVGLRNMWELAQEGGLASLKDHTRLDD